MKEVSLFAADPFTKRKGSLEMDREKRFIVRRWRPQKLLGKGTFGEVWQAKHVTTNEVAAVKFIALDDREEKREKQQMEIRILKTLEHKNIVQCKQLFVEAKRMVIVMQLCDYDLKTYKNVKTRSKNGYLSERETRHFMKQLGMHCLRLLPRSV